MFPLGHAGLPLAIAYIIRLCWPSFAYDARFLLLGTLLPDIVDKLVLDLSKGPLHSLWAALILFAAAAAIPRGRRILGSLASGVLSHQLLDLPWMYADAFLQPWRPDAFIDYNIHKSLSLATHPYNVAGEFLGGLSLLLITLHAHAWRPLHLRRFLVQGELGPTRNPPN